MLRDVRETVRKGYAAIARNGGSCCGPAKSCCGGNAAGAAKASGYSDAELAALPEGANMGLSCGNPTAIAGLKRGEVVLDLGAGGGFDVFLAARKVGPKGRAIGVDMTPEMVSKTQSMAKAAGLVGIVLTPRPRYAERAAGWSDPLYRAVVRHLPAGSKPGDYVTSLDVEARKR
jgi:SAM-dependent methyltransferase